MTRPRFRLTVLAVGALSLTMALAGCAGAEQGADNKTLRVLLVNNPQMMMIAERAIVQTYLFPR